MVKESLIGKTIRGMKVTFREIFVTAKEFMLTRGTSAATLANGIKEPNTAKE